MWDYPTHEIEINIIFRQPIIKRTIDTLESLTSTPTKLNEAANNQLAKLDAGNNDIIKHSPPL